MANGMVKRVHVPLVDAELGKKNCERCSGREVSWWDRALRGLCTTTCPAVSLIPPRRGRRVMG
jgi:hypothetical protein